MFCNLLNIISKFDQKKMFAFLHFHAELWFDLHWNTLGSSVSVLQDLKLFLMFDWFFNQRDIYLL